ncbi:MAG: amidohydrolase family protein [Sulfitobacter sp.]
MFKKIGQILNIIDSHHHLWAPQSDPDHVGYVWLRDIGAMKPFGDPTPIQRDYLIDEFLSEPALRQLAGSVHVQTDPKLPDPVAETAFIQKISDTSEHPIMIVGFADLTAGDFADQLARHLEYPNLKGIRQIISHLPERPDISFAKSDLLADLTWRGHYPLLAEHGLSFDLQLYPEQMNAAADFLAQHTDIPVVIDHLGCPHDLSDAGLKRWDEGMSALAALPHVSVKLSGYAMYFRGDLTGAAVCVTQDILRMFGPDRVMFGSNFPVDSLHLTYLEVLNFVEKQVGDDPASLGNVMHRNAHQFYRFGDA